MSVELNPTIVNVRDKGESAAFFSEILGLPKPEPFLGYFLVLRTSNGVSLDFIDSTDPIEPPADGFPLHIEMKFCIVETASRPIVGILGMRLSTAGGRNV